MNQKVDLSSLALILEKILALIATHLNKQLRAIAKQFNCAVLGLAQLKREVDSRSEKRPTKADFRESGGFEQEAAVMLGLYREDYYDKQTTQKGIFEVSVLKSRFSSETTVNLLFDERFGQFKNLAKSQY